MRVGLLCCILGFSWADEYESEFERKLSTIIIPEIEFEDTPLSDALEYLRIKSRELDESTQAAPKGTEVMLPRSNGVSAFEHKGGGDLGFDDKDSLMPDPNDLSQRPVTWRASNVVLRDALDEVCRQAGIRMLVDGENLLFVTEGEFELRRRMQQIVLPRVDINDSTVVDMLHFLAIEARRIEVENGAHPMRAGIGMEFRPLGNIGEKRVTYHETDISLWKLLKKLSEDHGLQMDLSSGRLRFTGPE